VCTCYFVFKSVIKVGRLWSEWQWQGQGWDIFLFSQVPRMAIVLIQSLVQCVLEALCLEPSLHSSI